MTRARVSAIVLAGGRSSRFGRDKLAEPIAGRPLLAHAIDAVRALASEVVVVVAPGTVPDVAAGVIVAYDDAAYEGPLAGVLAGLRVATGEPVLVTAGDMPELVPAVGDLLLEGLDRDGIDAVVLAQGGRWQQLPIAVRRGAALAVTIELIAAGERRLGALPEQLSTAVIEESTWRRLDPDAGTLRDVDTTDDLPQTHDDPRWRKSGGRRVWEGEPKAEG
jgi:molybdopterin-guanine dinucleotide biosynthesis protein A